MTARNTIHAALTAAVSTARPLPHNE